MWPASSARSSSRTARPCSTASRCSPLSPSEPARPSVTVRPSRKQARRDALFLLYQRDVTELTMEELVEGLRLREGYAPDDFTIAAVSGVLAQREALDATLAAHSTSWPVERMAPLERSILRLSFWEIESGVTPPEVAIDEAVRLAKRYASDEAGAFVNGVLGAIQRGREAGLELLQLADDGAHPGDGRGGLERGLRDAAGFSHRRPRGPVVSPRARRSRRRPPRRWHSASPTAPPRRWRLPAGSRHSRSPRRRGGGCCARGAPCAPQASSWSAPPELRRAPRAAPARRSRRRS